MGFIHIKQDENGTTWASSGAGRGTRATEIFEIDRVNPGILRKRFPFQNPGDATAPKAGENVFGFSVCPS
jgi:hypothetical protein